MGDGVQRALGVARQVGALYQVLAQAIGVLIRAPLPGAMRIGKIHAHLRLVCEEAVLRRFRTLVVREGAAELGRERPQFAREGLPDSGRVLLGQRYS